MIIVKSFELQKTIKRNNLEKYNKGKYKNWKMNEQLKETIQKLDQSD